MVEKLISLLSAVIIIFAVTIFSSFAVADDLTVQQKQNIYNYIKEYAFNEIGEFDADKTMLEMIKTLDDKHAFIEKIPKNNLDARLKQTSGYKGLGLVFMFDADTKKMKIVNVHTGPAKKAGMTYGFYVTCVNDVDVNVTDYESYKKFMDGLREDRPVFFCLEKDGIATKSPTIQLGDVKVDVVRLKKFDDDKIVYVRIDQFSDTVRDDMGSTLTHITRNYPDYNIIIDVRQNPGGRLAATASIINMMVGDKGQPIVITSDKDDNRTVDYMTTDNYIIPADVKIIVLIDGRSASASEVLASGLRDLRGSILVGTQSFGKGSVQSVVPTYGHMLKFTTNRYYTKSEAVIDGIGLTPDYIVENPEGFRVNMTDGPIESKDDPQLQKAVDLLTKKQ